MNTIDTPSVESLTLNLSQEIQVRASLETTFAALLEQMGPENETDRGKMPMKLEAWPGGRWFRDLGDNHGHFWETCRPSNVRHCSRLPEPCLFRTASSRSCSTG